MNANLVLYNGRIHAMDRGQPLAQAVAIHGRRVVAIGNDRDMLDLLAPTGARIDLAGRAVVPGFIDSHVHFVLFSLNLQQVNLTGVPSKAEAVAQIRARVETTPTGEWILGIGWDRNLWADPSFPDRRDLDAVAPRHPVALYSKDVHSTWVNSLALHLAGISADTPDPAGGEIVRDAETRAPTGILRETAQAFIYRVKSTPSAAAMRAALRAGLQHARSVGVTGFHDCEDEQAFTAFQELSADELTSRVYMHLPASNLDAAIRVGLHTGFGNDLLRTGGLKMFVDGALGSRSAYMLEPYAGDGQNRGIQVTDQATLRDLVVRASRAGISSAIHAIGDAANRQALDVLEEVRASEPDHHLRHRIEHVQILNAVDVPRLARLGVIASMQPQHATADIDLVETWWGGERTQGAYAWRKLLNTGARMAFGSDCPVETMDPLLGIHAAVTRRRVDGYPGPQGWRAEERLTVEEAVHAYTIGGAYASGEETLKGSLTPGKLADLVVLSRDIFSIPPTEIANTRVDLTLFDGRVVYERSQKGA